MLTSLKEAESWTPSPFERRPGELVMQ